MTGRWERVPESQRPVVAGYEAVPIENAALRFRCGDGLEAVEREEQCQMLIMVMEKVGRPHRTPVVGVAARMRLPDEIVREYFQS